MVIQCLRMFCFQEQVLSKLWSKLLTRLTAIRKVCARSNRNCTIPQSSKTSWGTFACSAAGEERKRKKYIIDFTIAYPEAKALGVTELCLNTFTPRCFKVFCRVHPLEGVPTQGDATRKWLYDRWQEKEQLLTEFYGTDTYKEASAGSSDFLRKWEKRAPTRSLKYTTAEMFAFHAFWMLLASVLFVVLSSFYQVAMPVVTPYIQ